MSVSHIASDSPVIQSLAVVAVGVAVLVFAAWLAQRWVQRPFWRRRLWRSALVASLVWMLAEAFGGNFLVARWMSLGSEVVASGQRNDRLSGADGHMEESASPTSVIDEPPLLADDSWAGLLASPEYEPSELPVDFSAEVVYDDAPREASPRGRDSFSPFGSYVRNTPAAKKTPDPVQYGALLLFCSAVGSATLVLWFLGRRIVVLWFTWRHTSPAPQAIVELVRSLLAPREGRSSRGARRLLCVESPRLTAPVVYGVWRPTLAVPVGFAESLPPDQLHAVLAHELVHVSGRDPLWQAVFDGLVTLAWWHPLVWLARSAHRTACEAAADAGAAATEGGPRALAAALVRLARHASEGPRLGWAVLDGRGHRRSRLGRRVLRLLREDAARGPTALGHGSKCFTTTVVGLLVTSLLFGTALARRHVSDRTYTLGEKTMTIWQSSWRSSLAAAAFAAMLGTTYADEADEAEDLAANDVAVELELVLDDAAEATEGALESLLGLETEIELLLTSEEEDEDEETIEFDEEEEDAEDEEDEAEEEEGEKEKAKEQGILSKLAKAKQLASAAAERKQAMVAKEIAMAKQELAKAQAQLVQQRDQALKQIQHLETEAKVAQGSQVAAIAQERLSRESAMILQLLERAKAEAAQGRQEAAQGIMERVRQILKVKRDDRLPALARVNAELGFMNESQRRLHHLIQAAENLRAIGKNDMAEALSREAQEIVETQGQEGKISYREGLNVSQRDLADAWDQVQREIDRRRGAENGYRGGNAGELRAEMNELRSQVNDMRAMLERVVERLEREGEEAEPR